MSRLQSAEEVPVNLFHAATIRDKEEATAKQHHIEMIKEGQINIFEVGQQEAKTKMVEQAIKKLQDEMTTSQANTYVQAVGAYLIGFVQSNEMVAEKILVEGKTIASSLDAMRKEAEKKKQNNMAVIAPDEGFAIVLKHFGISASAANTVVVQQVQKPAPVVSKTLEEGPQTNTTTAPKKRFTATLDDFL